MRWRTWRRWHVYALVGTFGAIIVLLSFVATGVVVREIIQRERQSVRFYAEMLRIFADPNRETDPFLFVLLDYIVPTISFPVVVTDPQDEPLYPYIQNTLNVGLDSSWSADVQRRYLKGWVEKMRQEFPPVSVVDLRGGGAGADLLLYLGVSAVDSVDSLCPGGFGIGAVIGGVVVCWIAASGRREPPVGSNGKGSCSPVRDASVKCLGLVGTATAAPGWCGVARDSAGA